MSQLQRGNILFLILLAVVLFAALSYAVTGSVRGGGKNASTEAINAGVAQLIQYSTNIENFVMRGMVSGDIKEYGFDFSGTNSGHSANATCVSNDCKVLLATGSELLPEALRAAAPTTDFRQRFQISSVLNVGTDLPDLVMIYSSLSLEACNAINRQAGVTPNYTAAEGWGENVYYSGTLTSFPATTSVIGDTEAHLIGQRTACFRHSANGYVFYHVLLIR